MRQQAQQIDQPQFIRSLEDFKKVKQAANQFHHFKGKSRQMFKEITCFTKSYNFYLTWMGKNWFCCRLKQAVGSFDLKRNEQIDLVELALRFPAHTETILGLRADPQWFSGLVPNPSRHLRFNILEPDFQQLYQQDGQIGIINSQMMKNLFLTEKDEFQELYFEAKLYRNNQVKIKFKEPSRCLKCNFAFDEIHNGLTVCSNPVCGQGKRQVGDIPLLPNYVYGATFIGHSPLKGQNLEYFKKLKKMPRGRRNNLINSLGNDFKYTNSLLWRGSLAGKVINADLCVVPFALADPILRAKNVEQSLPLEIKVVPYIEGQANRGVFATQKIPEHTVVALYTGEMMLSSQVPFWKYNNSIVNFGWFGNQAVSLYPYEFANVGRFFNGVVKKEKPNMIIKWVLVQNAETQIELVLILITTVDVEIGTELKWHYGPEFNRIML